MSDPEKPQEERRDSLGRRIGRPSRKGAENREKLGRVHAQINAAKRWGKHCDPIEIIEAAAQVGPNPAADRVVAKVLENRRLYMDRATAIATAAMPDLIHEMIKIGAGASKRATEADRIAATKLVRDHVIEQARAAGIDVRANLTEVSLAQLETLLAGTLSAVRDAQAIDSPAIRVPVTGTEGKDAPDPSSPGEPAAPAEQLDQADPAGGG